MKHFNIRIFGRVQGVSFRWLTQKKAKSLGLSGFVRNEPDSSVYIEAEGEDQALEKFIKWCKKGSWFALVDKITIDESAIVDYDDFTIKYI